MPSLHTAATLLANAGTFAGLRAIAHALGFLNALPLSAADRRRIGLPASTRRADLSHGLGALRCCCVQIDTADNTSTTRDTTPHDRLLHLARTLAQHAPAIDWTILLLDTAARRVTIAATTPHNTGIRIAALQVDPDHVTDADADTLRRLTTITEPDPLLRHARILDCLGRDALSTRFYRALAQRVETLADTAVGTASHTERRELALLLASRCLFLGFLEAKGWLDHDPHFLMRQLATHVEQGGHLHHRFLRPLFFGTLNTPRRHRAAAAHAFGAIPFLNGGLFTPTPLERARRLVRFTDDAIIALIGDLLDRYRFTTRESSTTWSEAAIDPEMLGRAFECLMANDERQRSGSFYTPPDLVETTVHEALRTLLPRLPLDALHSADGPAALHPDDAAALPALRVLDPACGSGAFLVHTLECLTRLQSRPDDATPAHLRRRTVLTHQIFGVDRNPMAVWLCELRLWLAVVIDCPTTDIHAIPPLPNLDHHIRVGDTLAGGDFQGAPPSARTLTTLRERYARATGPRKLTLARTLDRIERHHAIQTTNRLHRHTQHTRHELLRALRQRDLFGTRPARTPRDNATLHTLRQRAQELATQATRLQRGSALPFRFSTVFADIAATGGFHLVVGNPPWVRPHALSALERTRLRTEFATMRYGAWSATPATARQQFGAQPDLAAAFVERSLQLTAPHGVTALLLPAKLWRTLAGAGVRHWIATHATVRVLHDWSNAPSPFDAAVYPSLLVAEHTPPPNVHTPALSAPPATPIHTPPHTVRIGITEGTHTTRFTLREHSLPLGNDPAAPWLLLPDPARHAFERLRATGPALGVSKLGRPTLGVKCGCNAAFLLRVSAEEDELAQVHADDRRGVVERRLLRPVLRGETIHRTDADNECLVWTHAADGTPLHALPPATARWLEPWRPRLERRQDLRHHTPWWSLFRTDGARSDAPRLVWADISKDLRPRLLLPGDPTVPLNSCYVLRTASIQDALALITLFTSPIAAAWFDILAEPARGGFRRFLGWTVNTLPIPPEWVTARLPLAHFAKHTARHMPYDANQYRHEHLTLVANAYNLPLRHLDPLLTWRHA